MREQLLLVWERSVLATHHFLSENDFLIIKQIVEGFDFSELTMNCAESKGQIVGFVGTNGHTIEMLFVDSDFIGKGIGKMLIKYAMKNLMANEVTVNEQNTKALAFYIGHGFEVYGRQELDDLGLRYPILKLKKSSELYKR